MDVRIRLGLALLGYSAVFASRFVGDERRERFVKRLGLLAILGTLPYDTPWDGLAALGIGLAIAGRLDALPPTFALYYAATTGRATTDVGRVLRGIIAVAFALGFENPLVR